MRNKLILAAIAAASISPLTWADENSLTASFRVGATYVDGRTVAEEDGSNRVINGDFSIANFGSRIKWSGEKTFENGLSGIGYLEFGFNPDANGRGNSGIDRTRHAWGGIKGGFGTVKVGAQYASFYDMVSGHTDIAWWGSCWTQFECGRETRVLKYTGQSGGLTYSASLQGNPDDAGNDAADQVEVGVNYTVGDFVVGLATSMHADNGADKGGTLLGGVIKGKAGPVGLGLSYQIADEDFANANDDFTNVTLTSTFGNAYAVYNRGDDGTNNPQYGTLGYTLNIGSGALMYFEYQFIDDDSPQDEETILRATYKYDFGVL